MVQVCYNTFLKALNVSRFRVNRIAKMHNDTSEMPRERRGEKRIQLAKNLLTLRETLSGFLIAITVANHIIV